jgi:hypothetical protein
MSLQKDLCVASAALLAQKHNIDLLNKVPNPSLLRSGTGVQECDARKVNRITTARYKKILQHFKSIVSHSHPLTRRSLQLHAFILQFVTLIQRSASQ